LTLVLEIWNPENFIHPKQDGAISVLVDMYYPFTPIGGGRVSISGVDVIVYSWETVYQNLRFRNERG